ncbi:conserved Plasmodium protein, unknown function [Plasmodium gallinaceum]|uniref:Uncharacterized protein n=1 Tax=Plasmodium gallinaceum TaxID=5849 RepID=A0A1J1GXX1_PLAGA|nr:conserved Plasmodium protein, unknown function [Plasmodium gallinaceum]CRG97309.1 conserved Plasmodium protein, unknown function [Plasmodium gallinaceum]
MNTEKENKENNNEKDKRKDLPKDLENLSIKYSVYNSCFLLLSGLQLYFLGEKTNEKKNCVNLNSTIFSKKKKINKSTFFKNNFLNDYNMYYKEPKKSYLNEEIPYMIPLYKKNRKVNN